jgi:hypothetical protein
MIENIKASLKDAQDAISKLLYTFLKIISLKQAAADAVRLNKNSKRNYGKKI